MAATPKAKTTRRPAADGIGTVGGGWSNENAAEEDNESAPAPSILPRAMIRRPADEIVASGEFHFNVKKETEGDFRYTDDSDGRYR